VVRPGERAHDGATSRRPHGRLHEAEGGPIVMVTISPRPGPHRRRRPSNGAGQRSQKGGIPGSAGLAGAIPGPWGQAAPRPSAGVLQDAGGRLCLDRVGDSRCESAGHQPPVARLGRDRADHVGAPAGHAVLILPSGAPRVGRPARDLGERPRPAVRWSGRARLELSNDLSVTLLGRPLIGLGGDGADGGGDQVLGRSGHRAGRSHLCQVAPGWTWVSR